MNHKKIFHVEEQN